MNQQVSLFERMPRRLARERMTTMELVRTALGRYISSNEAQTFLEDDILDLLFRFRINPQNPNNVPMTLSDIARAVHANETLVLAAIDALRESAPPLIEEGQKVRQNRTFRITGSGVRFIRNLPQD